MPQGRHNEEMMMVNGRVIFCAVLVLLLASCGREVPPSGVEVEVCVLPADAPDRLTLHPVWDQFRSSAFDKLSHHMVALAIHGFYSDRGLVWRCGRGMLPRVEPALVRFRLQKQERVFSRVRLRFWSAEVGSPPQQRWIEPSLDRQGQFYEVVFDLSEGPSTPIYRLRAAPSRGAD